MGKRRITVRGRAAWLVAAIGLVSGVGAVLAGPSPTGSTVVDAIMLVGTVALAVWAAASAPWWTGVLAAAVAAALAPSALLIAVAVVAAVGGLAIGTRRRSMPWSRAIVAGLGVQVLARLGNLWFFGASALVGITCVSVLAVLGLGRRPGAQRRVLLWIGGVAGGVIIAAVVGAVVAAASARPHLQRGNQAAHSGISLLGAGDFAGAQAEFAQANNQFAQASNDLSRPWVQLIRLVPVGAQNREAGAVLADKATSVSATVASALTQIDPEKLRVKNGRIDIAAVHAVEAPLQRLADQLDSLEATIDETNSPWLAQPVKDRFADLKDELERQRARSDTALMAVREAPAMLGEDGPRTYFVAFTTPAEARGLGGFMGNWAELTITDGHIEMTAFGRTKDLEDAGDPTTKRLTGPADFLARYGDYGFVDRVSGAARPNIWHDITISPNFPSVAQVIAELYPQSGGKHLDGVFSMDVYTLATLLDATGPITIDGLDTPLTSKNAVQYLLRDQYLNTSLDQRIDLLEKLAEATVNRLLDGGLPSPPKLAKLLSPQISQQRLVGWASAPAEQALFQAVHLDGALPALNGGDGLAVTLNNSGNSKIDSYLDGTIDYSVTPDYVTHRVTGEVTVRLHNAAPATGVPDYVIGNAFGLPPGTSRIYLSVYTALPFTTASRDGAPFGFEVATEAGYLTSSAYIDLAPGQSSTIELQLAGTLNLSHGYSMVLRNPPAAHPFATTITVNGSTPLIKTVKAAGITRLIARPATS